MGFTWQQALGAVFISGCIFLILTVTGVRRWLVAGIPHSMRSAIAAGIGMFLGIIALKNAGIVVDQRGDLVDARPPDGSRAAARDARLLHHRGARRAEGARARS